MKRILERRQRPTRLEDHHDSEVSEVFRRLSTAEEKIGTLSAQIVGVSAQLKHQDQQLNTIGSQLDSIVASVQARSSTDWKTLAAWGGLLVSLVVLYTSLITSPLRENQARISSDISDANSRIGNLERGYVNDLKNELQTMEMRGRYRERIDAMGDRLDRMESRSAK